jgi:methylglyoxal synthase
MDANAARVDHDRLVHLLEQRFEGVPSTMLEPGVRLLRAGTVSEALYLVRAGTVRVETLTGDQIVLRAPTVLGEMGFLSGLPATADVVATGPVEAAVIDRAVFEGRLQTLDAVKTLYAALTRRAVARLVGAFHSRYTALVAHDGKKAELLELVARHRTLFDRRDLVATATTAQRLEQELGLTVVRRVRSGPHGGDQEIGALVSRGLVDAVFFFRDPLWAAPHEADVGALVRLCELADVPLATNPSTADAVVAMLERTGGTD